jgi:hypothetical protein
MAVTADVTGPHYEDRPSLVHIFVARFRHLHETALSPTETTYRIHDIRKTHHR